MSKTIEYQNSTISKIVSKALDDTIIAEVRDSKAKKNMGNKQPVNRFKKGMAKPENSGRKKGQVSPKMAFWHVFADNIMNEGTEKAWSEIMKLEGTQYLSAYIMLLEYFKPKLGRIESVNTNIDIPVVQIVAPNQLPAMPSNLDDIEDVGHEEVK
jgi:hypothetical protein